MKNKNGITLIALVITIIVLIILAGVAINLTLGDNGVFDKAKYAKEETIKAGAKEKIELAILESYSEEGKIIYGNIENYNGLENNINKIEGLYSKITEPIESFPVYITIDGYEFEIKLNGQVIFKGESDLEVEDTKQNDETLAKQSLVMVEDFEKQYGVIVNNEKIDTSEKKFGNASLYLNKTTITNSNQVQFNFSSDFTIDYWIKLSQEDLNKEWAGNIVVGKKGGIWIGFNSGQFIVRSYEQTNLIKIDPPAINEWVHIAICRNNNILYVFYNGDLQTQIENNSNFSQGNLYIGSTGEANYTMDSYMDELRIVNGEAKWTSNFSVPTEEYDDVDSIIYHFNSEEIYTNLAQINEVEKKFGNRSIYLNNTDISYKENEGYKFDSDFTIDYWLKYSRENLSKEWAGNLAVQKTGGVWIGFNSGQFIVRSYEQATRMKIAPPPAEEWVHIAVCRKDGILYVFYNGELQEQIENTSSFVKGNLYIGSTGRNENYVLNTYIDELRILNGYCAWTKDFEVPTNPYEY